VDSGEHGNESPSSIQDREFNEKLNGHRFLNRDSIPLANDELIRLDCISSISKIPQETSISVSTASASFELLTFQGGELHVIASQVIS